MASNDCDPVLQNRRQDYLEWLYARSGRTSQLYTGLLAERVQQLIAADMDASLGPLGDWAA